jgi:hypothetical protein
MTATRRPWIGNYRLAVTVGIVLFAAAVLILWDAHDGRGRKMPWPLRIALPM